MPFWDISGNLEFSAKYEQEQTREQFLLGKECTFPLYR